MTSNDLGQPNNPPNTAQRKRCVIYTRKSTEEGLEQDFNSLDAQRESGVAYIRSQQHEGWQLVETAYDDGGYSGGTIERPALRRLLADIAAGHVDVVVVYKVDRLSRALADFAQMVQLFEQHAVSFVSVTQQFNTTTSMGRLTLNVLLSFAQFEREVTGERIRDKIAASKKKGMWMGGPIPFGYRLAERRLYPHPVQAKQLVAIYKHYAEHGSLLLLTEYCKQRGYGLVRQAKEREGHASNDGNDDQNHIEHTASSPPAVKPFYRQQLHRLLTNPLYIGQVTHKDQVYDGQHDGVIDQSLWDAVQAKMQSQDLKSQHRWQQPYLLKGLLRSGEGYCLSPATLHKQQNKKKRLIRYYTSQKAIQQGYKNCDLKSLNARALDDLVRSQVGAYCLDRHQEGSNTGDVVRYLESLSIQEQDHHIRQLIQRVTVSTRRLVVVLSVDRLQALRQRVMTVLVGGHDNPEVITPLPVARYQAQVITAHAEDAEDAEVTEKAEMASGLDQCVESIRLVLDIQIKRQGQSRMILTPDGKDLVMPQRASADAGLVAAVCKGQHWHALMLARGWSFDQLAEHVHTDVKNAHGWIALTYLAPAITKRILQGRHLPSWTLKRLIQAAKLPLWDAQYRLLGIEDQLALNP